jgi:replicative DNA helicase
VASLADGVPRATNVEYYAKIVKEKATLRNLIYAANKIVAEAYGAEQESDLILDEAEGAIFAVAEDRLKAGFVEMRDLVKENFRRSSSSSSRSGSSPGCRPGSPISTA